MAAVDRVGLGPQAQRHVASVGGAIGALDLLEMTRDQREQVTRLGMRIDEAGEVAATGQLARPGLLAAREQYGKTGLVGG